MNREKPKQHDDRAFDAYDPAEAISLNPANIGSDFNAFLADEGIHKDVQASVLKRVIVFQI